MSFPLRRSRTGSPGARGTLALFAAALLLAGCRELTSLRETMAPATPHEAYARSLRGAGLHETALGREWIDAAGRALRRPHPVTLPYREAALFPPDEPGSLGFRFPLREGERLRVAVERSANWSGRAFVDLFRATDDTAAAPRWLASADTAGAELDWTAREDAAYLLRVQPELLRGGRLVVTLRTGPSLAFPVTGRDSRAVGSRFGAARDEGRRDHHGIDIFAPRGTPVVAAAGGTVRSVQTTGLGGKVVWLREDERGLSLYYAHLDSQRVAPGTRVRAGDTLGTVGNTGNARGTAPHLHFGVYRPGRGPADPYPFVHEPRAEPPALAVDADALGAWRRTSAASRLRAAPSEREAAAGELARQVPVRPMGGSGAWYRVRTPDGREGYLPARATEAASRPVRSVVPGSGALVLLHPRADAVAVDSVPASARVPVLGLHGGFLLVRTPAGRTGWIRE